ncbi:MAG: hypothetical protein R2867_04215 [Caldilineaceae bacterium]
MQSLEELPQLLVANGHLHGANGTNPHRALRKCWAIWKLPMAPVRLTNSNAKLQSRDSGRSRNRTEWRTGSTTENRVWVEGVNRFNPSLLPGVDGRKSARKHQPQMATNYFLATLLWGLGLVYYQALCTDQPQLW